MTSTTSESARLRAANEEIGQILARGTPAEGTRAFHRLMELTDFVEVKEAEQPFPATDPIEAIMFRLEQLELSRKALEGVLGSRARVSEVLNRRRELSKEMIVRLHLAFDIPLESLLGIPERRRGLAPKE